MPRRKLTDEERTKSRRKCLEKKRALSKKIYATKEGKEAALKRKRRNRANPDQHKKELARDRDNYKRKIASRMQQSCFIENIPKKNVEETNHNSTQDDSSMEEETNVGKEIDVKEEEYRRKVRSLNTSQQELLKHIMYHVNFEKEPMDCFISGLAGTGKSFLIDVITQTLRRYYGRTDSVLLTALTGMAASHINGSTLHSAFSLPFNRIFQPSKNLCKLKNVKVLIIDEISTVGKKIYEDVNEKMKWAKGCDKPFGGVHCLKFGDLLQLGPVWDSHCYTSELWQRTLYYELDEIMRQRDEKDYCLLLKNIALGTMTPEQVEFMRSKVVSQVPNGPILLYWKNEDMKAANQRRLLEFSSETIVVTALDTISGPSREILLQKTSQINKLLPATLQLKVGARYMLTLNLNISNGLVNGAIGILKRVETERIWIRFLEEYDQPIDKVKMVVDIHEGSSLSREQFPVQVAEAITVHKSQGSTFQAVGIQSGMSRALQYVACSRVKSPDGLYLMGDYVPPQPLDHLDPIYIELQRLKAKTLVPRFAFLQNCNEPHTLQFMFHNVESLPKYRKDIMADSCFMHSDFLLLSETRTLRKDIIKFPGFEEIDTVYSNWKKPRKPQGVAIYMKEKFCNIFEKRCSYNPGNGIQMSMVYLSNQIRLAVLYAKPGTSVDDITEAIYNTLGDAEEYTSVLVGNFNLRFDKDDGKCLCENISDLGLYLRTNPKHYTTRANTTVDAIFSTRIMKSETIVTGVYESCYSHHRPLYGRI